MKVQWQDAASFLVAGLAAVAFVTVHEMRVSAIVQGALVLVSAFSFMKMRALRDLRKDADYRKHGAATAWWHLVTTNAASVGYAWFMYDGYVASEAAFKAFGNAAKDWMLVSGVVGGTLALFRSSGTNSAALAALQQNEQLRAEIVSLGRRLGDATALNTMALDAAQAPTFDKLMETLGRMVTLASDLPEKSDAVDAFTIWIRDPDRRAWRILSGRGVSAETLANFQQPALSKETKGGGIVANMAATGQAQFIQSTRVSTHAWYASDPDSKRKTEGFAAVLIADRSGKPCGALCLTSQDARGIPSVENAQELQRFEKVLQLWAGAFALPVHRYFELIEKE